MKSIFGLMRPCSDWPLGEEVSHWSHRFTSSFFTEGQGVWQSLPWHLSKIGGLAYFTFCHLTVTELKTANWGGLFPFMADVVLSGGLVL